MHKLVLLRHGESQWNLENRFTGWVDVPLTATGIAQARAAGQRLHAAGLEFDLAYTSVLQRAIHTLWHCLDTLHCTWLPVHKDWRLNERHYGGLQGWNKAQTAAQHGDAQVQLWRRSYEVPPPPMTEEQAALQSQDRRYQTLSAQQLPRTECLKDTVARVLPHWNAVIAPQIQQGRRLLIAAHGNSLRALIKHLDQMSAADILELNIPNGQPLIYELNAKLQPIRHYYLS